MLKLLSPLSRPPMNAGSAAATVLLFLLTQPPSPAAAATVADLDAAADKFDVRLTVPEFPTDEAAVTSTIDGLIAEYTELGDAIAASAGSATFASTVGAIDELYALAWDVLSPVEVIENTSPDAALREAATRELQRFREFEVGFWFREDIYEAVKAFAESAPELSGEAGRLLEETVRGYRRKVTINSTVGLAALQAGVATHALGQAIYRAAGLTDQRDLDAFWQAPHPPDRGRVDAFCRFIAARFHVPGAFDGPGAVAGADNLARWLANPPPARISVAP